MEKDTNREDSSDEGASGSDDEIVLLQAVNKIITRSLKRSRARSRLDNVQRKKITRDRRQGRQVVDKDVSISKSRYNVNYLLQIMKDFDDNQRKFIRDIDFGFLLEMDGGAVPWSFVQWIADHVDVQNEEMSFQEKSIPITEESFGHVLGISTSGNPVPPESKASTAEFLQLFGLSELPSVKFFEDKIIKKGQEKDEFIRCFMVVAFASFFCPTSSTKPSTSYLASIIHTDRIASYNWGKYVHNWNLVYIKKYQRFSGTLAVCNYYLAVRYLDFVDFGTFQTQPTLPRVKVWRGDMIKEYIKLDMDEDNFYGKRPIKHICETCYPSASTVPPPSNAYAAEQLKRSIKSFEHCVFNDKVTTSICSLFEQCTLNETKSSCSKIKGLLINVIECLIENNCVASSSQSTEKVICSIGDENKSNGSTIKLQSSDASSDLNENQGKSIAQKEHPDTALCTSQHSANSVSESRKRNIEQEAITTTDQIIARLVEPITKSTSTSVIDEKKEHNQILDVNNALCNLKIKDKNVQAASNKSASLDHMLNDDSENAAGQFDGEASRELKEATSNYSMEQREEDNSDNDPKTPTRTLAMFGGINDTTKEYTDSMYYINSSSIQCAQKTHISDKHELPGINMDTTYSSSGDNPELSSQSRLKSFSSQEKAADLENMNIDDFEVDCGQPSISFM